MPADPADIERVLREIVSPAVYPRRSPLAVEAHHVGGEPIPFAEALWRGFEPFDVGEPWGPMWDTTWFRFSAQVPPGWSAAVALVHLGGDEMVGFSAEGLVWSPSGTPLQGVHHRHREVSLDGIRAGDRVEFLVEAAANPIPPWHLPDWPDLRPDYAGKPLYTLGQAEIADPDREMEALKVDMSVLLQAGKRSPYMLEALSDACRLVEGGAPTSEARAVLRPLLDTATDSTHRVAAVGHAHIDSAWLWPVRETRRKCARTFANQLRLMERYPEHRFACSQAAQYMWIKEEHPGLYDQIRTRVAEGRWEPLGGMWVEADSNVPSGESLLRQLVHGKRYFAEEFGVETAELWIPDVFGYSAALPQIARHAGVTAIVTQKMSWNDTNSFPHTTFWWEGHDGSRLLAHFPPADTYNGVFSVSEVAACQENHRDLGRSDTSLYAFGYGDGGGGPTARMLERSRRLADFAGLPRVTIGSVGGFLSSVDTAKLRTWTGELYLEAHRATLTTHADVKLANRRGEETLREAELWSVAAGVDSRERLDEAWKRLLFNQFHDIIPGSSIAWVYDDAALDYAEVQRISREVIEECLQSLASTGAGSVFNASSYDRREVVDVAGNPAVVSAPGCGWASLSHASSGDLPAGWDPVVTGDGWFDNGVVRVAWDPDGLLVSVRDHVAGREVLPPGERGNVFQIHEDRPRAFDAWDVDRSYLESCTDVTEIESIEVVEAGPLRASVRSVRRFGSSTITQVMSLAAGSRRIDFRTEVDWQERHTFLKVAFPVDVRAARATYEIQHGHIERPTVTNTSWDEARFEVCAHRWADLGEPGYGVALLNDCKYGYDIRGPVMRLSLLRGPGYPDPGADRGTHRFVYALMPHPGDFRDAGVVEEAERLNLPLRTGVGTAAASPGRVVEVDRRGVSIEAVKLADDGDGFVVRICEVHGARGPARVTLHGAQASRAWRCDALERRVEEITLDGRSADLVLRPFELVTLRFAG